MDRIQNNPGPKLVENNIVEFPTGEKIEIYSGRILIHDKDQRAMLRLSSRMTEDFCDSNGNPSFYNIYWPTAPSWSDGRELGHSDVLCLAAQVKCAAGMISHPIRQVFADINLYVEEPHDFNTV